MKSVSAEDLATVRRILREQLTGTDTETLVFGSRVTGGATEASDLDLLLRSDQPIPLDMMSRLREAFEESDLPFEVDLMDERDLVESFRDRILPTAVRLDLKN